LREDQQEKQSQSKWEVAMKWFKTSTVKTWLVAAAVGISKQGLEQNPDSEKAQPVLKLFERIARLRAHPQFKAPADLRKWFRRPLPLFSNHSAEELFKAGKLEVVAEKVDQMLTGDFGG